MLSYALDQREGYPEKPDPKAPLFVVSELDAELGNCAFIGDTEVDIKTAKNMGVTSIGCAWGYRPREVLVDSGADFVISRPEELLDIFK
jgi:phosphoglycolate phosphatase